jgi:hypothetical protein
MSDRAESKWRSSLSLLALVGTGAALGWAIGVVCLGGITESGGARAGTVGRDGAGNKQIDASRENKCKNANAMPTNALANRSGTIVAGNDVKPKSCTKTRNHIPMSNTNTTSVRIRRDWLLSTKRRMQIAVATVSVMARPNATAPAIWRGSRLDEFTAKPSFASNTTMAPVNATIR